MLRNDLITHLGQKDNDPVVVEINGKLLEVTKVTDGPECIVLVLDDGHGDSADSDT